MLILVIRTVITAICIFFWHSTQQFLGRRVCVSAGNTGSPTIHDEVHWSTSLLHAKLAASPKVADILLAVSSVVVDCLGLFLFGLAIFGPTFEPVIGMVLLFVLRLLAQLLCHLQPPKGIIWRSPGIPSLFVTYDVQNDLFFSGHTAFAVYAACVLHSLLGNSVGISVGITLVAFQIATVLILRVHYTMDVFTGVFCALYVYEVSHRFSPLIDNLLQTMVITAV